MLGLEFLENRTWHGGGELELDMVQVPWTIIVLASEDIIYNMMFPNKKEKKSLVHEYLYFKHLRYFLSLTIPVKFTANPILHREIISLTYF